LLLASILVLTACSTPTAQTEGDPEAPLGGTAAETTTETPASPSVEVPREPATPEGADIIIPLADINETARFYPSTVDGLSVEVLAIRASDGTVRTALNTCQVCYDSGYGYYVQEGNELVCQNCGNRFPADLVQIESGGCNPVPIFEDMRSDNGTNITIPADLIAASAGYFENWK
jgi:uncharacterized membrane protein